MSTHPPQRVRRLRPAFDKPFTLRYVESCDAECKAESQAEERREVEQWVRRESAPCLGINGSE